MAAVIDRTTPPRVSQVRRAAAWRASSASSGGRASSRARAAVRFHLLISSWGTPARWAASSQGLPSVWFAALPR
jgi:hypothetical protein